MWELMTRGVTPYPDIEVSETRKYLTNGHRLRKPKYCPDNVYANFCIVTLHFRVSHQHITVFSWVHCTVSLLGSQKVEMLSLDIIFSLQKRLAYPDS